VLLELLTDLSRISDIQLPACQADHIEKDIRARLANQLTPNLTISSRYQNTCRPTEVITGHNAMYKPPLGAGNSEIRECDERISPYHRTLSDNTAAALYFKPISSHRSGAAQGLQPGDRAPSGGKYHLSRPRSCCHAAKLQMIAEGSPPISDS
jgi:hypothetical protein